MRDPCIAADGRLYEKAYFKAHLKRHKQGLGAGVAKSPITNEPLEHYTVYASPWIKSQIQGWVDAVMVPVAAAVGGTVAALEQHLCLKPGTDLTRVNLPKPPTLKNAKCLVSDLREVMRRGRLPRRTCGRGPTRKATTRARSSRSSMAPRRGRRSPPRPKVSGRFRDRPR